MEKANIHQSDESTRVRAGTVRNGNITATKGDITLRFVPRADYIVYIDTPTVTAIVRKDATDDETLRIVDGLTA